MKNHNSKKLYTKKIARLLFLLLTFSLILFNCSSGELSAPGSSDQSSSFKLAHMGNINLDNDAIKSANSQIVTAQVGNTNYLFISLYELELKSNDYPEYQSYADSLDRVILDNRINIKYMDYKNSENFNDLIFRSSRYLITTEVGRTNYLFLSSFTTSRLAVFSIDRAGNLANPFVIKDNDSLNLSGTSPLATAKIGGTTYIFVGGWRGNGISSFAVNDNGSLNTNTSYNLNYDSNPNYNLFQVSSLASAKVGGNSYLFVGGSRNLNQRLSSGVSVFSVNDNGSLEHVDNAVFNDDAIRGNNFLEMTTLQLGENTYLFVVGNRTLANEFRSILPPPPNMPTPETFGPAVNNNGIRVFLVGDNGGLSEVFELSANSELKGGFFKITTAAIGDNTYLFIAASKPNTGLGGMIPDDSEFAYNGVSVFLVGATGSLREVYTVADNANLKLAGANSISTMAIDGRTYLFVAGSRDSGVTIFRVDP